MMSFRQRDVEVFFWVVSQEFSPISPAIQSVLFDAKTRTQHRYKFCIVARCFTVSAILDSQNFGQRIGDGQIPQMSYVERLVQVRGKPINHKSCLWDLNPVWPLPVFRSDMIVVVSSHLLMAIKIRPIDVTTHKIHIQIVEKSESGIVNPTPNLSAIGLSMMHGF